MISLGQSFAPLPDNYILLTKKYLAGIYAKIRDELGIYPLDILQAIVLGENLPSWNLWIDMNIQMEMFLTFLQSISNATDPELFEL